MSKRDSSSFELKIFGNLRYGDRLKQSLLAFVVIVAAGALGSTLLHSSRAATPVASTETESGTISAPASVVTDATASGGHAVQFGGGGAGGGGTATCSGAANIPGGADPWGGCFPGPNNTGVPAGTKLTTYTGTTDFKSCGAVISNVIINSRIDIDAGNGTKSAATPCVTIKDSIINGIIGVNSLTSSDGPLVMIDDEIAATITSGTEEILSTNYYLDGVNMHGGNDGGAECYGDCSITNSWIHDLYLSNLPNGNGVHDDAIISNGNMTGGPMTFNHNSLACGFYAESADNPSGGCSADVGLYGDFGPISSATLNNNLFVSVPLDVIGVNTAASANCAYGGTLASKKFPVANNVTFTNNVLQRGKYGKCGLFGPVVDFSGGTNVNYAGNTWDDHTTTSPGTTIPEE